MDYGKRFTCKELLDKAMTENEVLTNIPDGGWLKHCYDFVLSRLFPEKRTPQMASQFEEGRHCLLNYLQKAFADERECCSFDPTRDFIFLEDEEVLRRGYNDEYIKMHRFVKDEYVYEMMRIGAEITPFDTLGHVAGVHYVSMYVASQLAETDLPIDLALVSGAAAGHDIGKYGCKASEAKRVPYLHYYYTDQCYRYFDMPTIGHIGANHSVWDLELESLPVESLILIYADFRVKSSRESNGREVIHFYSLDEAYDVILNKLDNVDEAKALRYRKVYNKLKDFENYMVEMGVETKIPDEMPARPPANHGRIERKIALLNGQDVIDQLKYASIEHSIRLMGSFHSDAEFSSLIETARSERQWKNVRSYITIFQEYSTYMTEKQKLLTLNFLYEMLFHREGDIRSQSATIMGKIISNFSEEYMKEVPEDVTLPDRMEDNLRLFEEYFEAILHPDYKISDHHIKRIQGTLSNFTKAIFANTRPGKESLFFDRLQKFYEVSKEEIPGSEEEVIALLDAALILPKDKCTESFLETVGNFLKTVYGKYARYIDLAVMRAGNYFFADEEAIIRSQRAIESDEKSKGMAAMFLDDLKASTPWIEKIINIEFMQKDIPMLKRTGVLMHVATHFSNLVKVSEAISVRQSAGRGLINIIGNMSLEQRNELAVELYNGLELGDYQFSKYIPDYLGIINLYLPPKELNETIQDLKIILDNGSDMAASSVLDTFGVMLENYALFEKNFDEPELVSRQRKFKILNLIVKSFASYNQVISQEAFWVLGNRIFKSDVLTTEEKTAIFLNCYKRLAYLVDEKKEDSLEFYNNAAVLNSIYRYIGQYEIEIGEKEYQEKDKVCFFPGTFDPFTLAHKAVATTIRDLDFDVYLALDEFSWSKNTQPRLQRRKIMTMSIADENDIFIFPEDISVNIANQHDIAVLKKLFEGKELYIAVGSDVVKNASAYKKEPGENTIHTLNHILFERESDEQKDNTSEKASNPVTADVIYLKIGKLYEDISSTKIRENIDMNRDISNLIDNTAQKYIYDKNLYLREPAYKHVLMAREIEISALEQRGSDFAAGVSKTCVRGYLDRKDVKSIFTRSANGELTAYAAAHKVERSDLLPEFDNLDIASTIREKAAGSIAVIGALRYTESDSYEENGQIILTELLTELLARDFTFAVFNPRDKEQINKANVSLLKGQGFVNIAGEESPFPVYAVDMSIPNIIFRDVETVIKNPLNKNPEVQRVIEESHERLCQVLNEIYPGHLNLSFNTSAMHNKIINIVTAENHVAVKPDPKNVIGPYMSVPFGKTLSEVVVPNTVTKTLHTEKYYNSTVTSFTIAESKYHAKLENQAETIKSFDRPVILIDDLLHKSYRMNIIDPLLRKHDVEVKKIVVGVLSGKGKDQMMMKGRKVESAYFLPALNVWLNEKDVYPFIGGDGIENSDRSINQILPYSLPNFIGNGNMKQIYEFSKVCLENAKAILEVLEREYQNTFERKLTLKRLGEVITGMKMPDTGFGVSYDENCAPSVLLQNDIEKLARMHIK